MLTATCVKGEPGPHHYVCGSPTSDDLVYCVCRNCGDEKDLPAYAGRRQDQMSREEWQKFKRLRASRGVTQARVQYSGPEEGKISTESEPKEDEIRTEPALIEPKTEPEIVQNQDEIRTEPAVPPVPVEDQKIPEGIQKKRGIAMVAKPKDKEKKRQEYEAAKDNIIATWHRHHEDTSATARELKIPKSTLYGKLKQWRLILQPKPPAGGSARLDGNYRFKRHEELEAQKEKIIACWRKHGGNINQASKELKIFYSTLKGKLIQWELVPGWKSYKKRCPARTGGDPTGTQALVHLNNLLTGLYDERARIDNMIQSVKTAMDLLKLQEVTAK